MSNMNSKDSAAFTETQIAPKPAQPRKNPWIKRGIIIAAIVIMVPIVSFCIARLIYNDGYIREKIQASLREATGREVSVEGLECSILSGTMKITNIAVPNTSPAFKDKDTARVAGINVEFSPLSIAFSKGKNISDAKIRIVKPEIMIERRGHAPMAKTNIDDLIEKFTGGPPGTWPKQTGLSALSAQIAIEDGVFSFRDNDKNLGESRIERLSLSATQPGLGEALTAKLKFALTTPASKDAGQADIDARINWIDSNGAIDYRAFKDVLVSGKLDQIDTPHLLRYAGVQMRLKDRYTCTLGKAHTGTLKIEAPTLEKITIDTGFESDGALSIYEGVNWVAGQLPVRAKVDAELSMGTAGLREGPIKAVFTVASSKEALADKTKPPLLDLEIQAGAAGGSKRTYSIGVKTAEELFATDVAAVLDLKGNIGGIIEGKLEAEIQNSGHAQINGAMKTKDGYVAMNNVRQKTSVDMSFGAKLEPNEDGRPDRAELNFMAKAGTAFEIGSTRAAKISSLSDPRNVAADAEMNLKLLGREFWSEFGPLLKVIGLGTPLNESLTGTLRLSGSAGKLGLGLDGTLQQQNETPNPLRLAITGAYDGNALAEKNEQPWLKLNVALKSAADKSVDLKIPLTISRSKSQQVYDLPEFSALGELAGITQLNARFAPYSVVFLDSRYKMAGFIKQTGNSRLVESLDDKGVVTGTHLTLNTDVQVMQLHLTGPALFPGAPALNYSEKDAFSLKTALEFKKQGKTAALSIKPLSLKSSAVSIEGEIGEVDVVKAAAIAANEQRKLSDWVTVLPEAKLEASVNADGVKQLQANGVLPPEELAQGDLILKVDYNPVTRKAALQPLRFRNAGLNLTLNAADVDAAALAALIDKGQFSAAASLEALPSFALECAVRRPLLERLKQLKLVPAEVDLLNDVVAKATYDRTKKSLALDAANLTGPGIEALVTAPAINAVSAAAAIDAPPQDLAGIAALLTSFQADAKIKPATFDTLKTRGILPADPNVRGELAFKGVYDAAADRLAVEAASFKRADQSTVPLSQLEMTCESIRLGALLKDLQKASFSPALLAHLDKGVSIKSATLAPVEGLQLLKRQKIGGAAIDEMLSGTLKFPQAWTLTNLQLKPGDKPNKYTLSLDASIPCAFHQRPSPTEPPAQEASAWLSGTVRVDQGAPLKFDFSDGIAVQGMLFLDPAEIQARRFGFEKPAGAACGYSFNAAYGNDGSIRIAALNSLSGPWSFTLSDLALTAGKIALQKFAMTEGPIKGTFSDVIIDQAADKAKATVEMESLDVGKVYALAPLSPRLKLGGTASAVKLSYDGRLSALQSGTFAATDKLTLSLRPALRVEAASGSAAVAANINGDLTITPQRLFSKVLALEVDHNNGAQRTNSRLAVALDVAPLDQKELLLNAISQPGLPLVVKVPVTSEQLIDLDGVLGAVSVIADAASPAPATPKPAGDNSGIAKLRVETTVTAPQAKLGIVAQLLDTVTARMDSLMVDVPNAKIRLYGGILELLGGKYNLALTPLRHEQQLVLTNLDINAATGKPADSTVYEYSGLVSGRLGLKGSGFEQQQRGSWNGDIELNINELVAKKEKESFSETATKIGAAELGKLLGDEFSGRVLNIFSEDFGLFLKKMEFEPLKIAIKLENGIAHVQRGSLIGKVGTRSEGIQVDFAGAINLAANAFTDEGFRLILIKLPPGTQKQLRLDQLDEADRQAELEIFAAGKFKPIIIKGPLNAAGVDNKVILTNEFYKMDSRITKKIKEKKAREAGHPQPPAQGQPEQPAQAQPKEESEEKEEKKGGLFGTMEDMLKKELKKRKKD
ncbi:MAG TPA: hypothetical protein VEJ63_20190 [Planctomycetota bacterium]|nr:hypothetical protein [Planctomycetota bacterium]